MHPAYYYDARAGCMLTGSREDQNKSKTRFFFVVFFLLQV